MKKYVLSFITLFAMCLTISLTSCGKDEEDPNTDEPGGSKSLLIGTWVLVRDQGTYSGGSYDDSYSISEQKDVVELYENGRCHNFRSGGYDLDSTWELKGEDLTFVCFGRKQTATIVSLTPLELVVEASEGTRYEKSTYMKTN